MSRTLLLKRTEHPAGSYEDSEGAYMVASREDGHNYMFLWFDSKEEAQSEYEPGDIILPGAYVSSYNCNYDTNDSIIVERVYLKEETDV